jgi:hypothetical protein
MVSLSPRARLGLALVLLVSLGGCAAQQRAKMRDEDLQQLTAWLPGRYDNLVQVAHDEKTGVQPPHDRIALLIMPVYAPRLGHHVFFVQEMAPDNAERIMSQRMFSFDTDEDRGVVGLMYNFIDPVRWREAAGNPQLLTGVMTEDVTPSGCEMVWQRAGEAIVARYDSHRCARHSAPGVSEATLTPEELYLAGFEFRKR